MQEIVNVRIDDRLIHGDDDRYGTAVELGVSDRGNEKAHRDSEPGQLL